MTPRSLLLASSGEYEIGVAEEAYREEMLRLARDIGRFYGMYPTNASAYANDLPLLDIIDRALAEKGE